MLNGPKSCKVSTLHLQMLTQASKNTHSYPFEPLIKSILVSLHWCFALVFDYFVPILPLLTFELITSHHGRILGTKGIKTHKFQAGILHLPLISAARPSTLRKKSDSHWKGRPLACSEGLIIKSIPPYFTGKLLRFRRRNGPHETRTSG